jgi:ApaG protein
MKTLITNGIRISVSYQYQNRYSDEDKQDHVFFYKISVKNCSLQKVKLLSQYRELVDSIQMSVSKKHNDPNWEQPDILPGQTLTYDCACSLESPIGKLKGHLEIAFLGPGEVINAQIPETEFYATSILN